jgi:hypothetical protein
MKKADAIIARAKKEIVDFICFETPLLYKKFGWAEPTDGDNHSIATCDLHSHLTIKVEVDNSYLDIDDTCYEESEIAEILVNLNDKKIWACTEYNEYNIDEISIEELVDIANAIEAAYLK